jgi:hypothetical protein
MADKTSVSPSRPSRQEPRLAAHWTVGMWTEDGMDSQMLYTRDIATTGMCLQGKLQENWSPNGGDIGMKFPVKLYLPGEFPLTEIEAELKWQNNSGGQALSGWRFTRITPESRRLLYEKIEILHPLSLEDVGNLSLLEKIIESKRGSSHFYDVGKALEEICDRSLCRDNYPDFIKYCQRRWDMPPKKVFQLINAANIIDNIARQGASVLPQNEALVEPLTILLPDIQWKVWQAVLASTEDGHITKRFVQEAVDEFLKGGVWRSDSGEAHRAIEIEEENKDAFKRCLAEAKYAFKKLCKAATELDSIEEVIGKVDNRINQYWWKNLSIIFRSDFTESADGHVEFKRFNAEM